MRKKNNDDRLLITVFSDASFSYERKLARCGFWFKSERIQGEGATDTYPSPTSCYAEAAGIASVLLEAWKAHQDRPETKFNWVIQCDSLSALSLMRRLNLGLPAKSSEHPIPFRKQWKKEEAEILTEAATRVGGPKWLKHVKGHVTGEHRQCKSRTYVNDLTDKLSRSNSSGHIKKRWRGEPGDVLYPPIGRTDLEGLYLASMALGDRVAQCDSLSPFYGAAGEVVRLSGGRLGVRWERIPPGFSGRVGHGCVVPLDFGVRHLRDAGVEIRKATSLA